MLRKPHYCTLLVLWLLSTTVFAAPPEGKGGGKGGGGSDGGDSMPTVRYSIDLVSSPASNPGYITDMNSLSMFIGNSDRGDGTGPHAFLYDQPTGTYHDIRAIDSLVLKLEGLISGYRFSQFRSINNLGAMTGLIYDTTNDYRRGVLLETFLSSNPDDWVVSLLPDLGEPGTYGSFGLQINDNGDILGLYHHSGSDNLRSLFLYNHTPETPPPPVLLGFNVASESYIWLNNHGQVAGPLEDESIFFYDPTAQEPLSFIDIGVEDSIFNDNQVGGLNDSGVISGNIVDHQFGGKGKRNDVVYRFTNQLEVVARETPFSAGSARINSSNDVVYAASDSSGSVEVSDVILVHTGFSPEFVEQSWNIKDLIAANDPYRDLYNSESWSVASISDRSGDNDATGYPQIVVSGGGNSIVLTPFVPKP